MSNLPGNTQQHVMTQNVMKEEFGWEIPVEMVPIPSNGLIYDPNSTLYKKDSLKIKAMTAREEDILSSGALIKEGTAIDHLIKSCVVEENFDPFNLVLGDKNALMVSIRITGYGSNYNIRPNCEDCGKVNDINFDLSGLEIKRLNVKPIELGKNEFEFTFPVTKKVVRFKFLTSNDERERDKKQQFFKNKMGISVENNITSYLEAAILSVQGITDRNKINHFIKNMPAYDSKSLRSFIRDNEPGIDMSHEFMCQHCQHVNKANLAITPEFFWPRT
jgi:hypothetical protein